MWGLWAVYGAVMGAALLLALSMFLLRKRAASRRGLRPLVAALSGRQCSTAAAEAALPADLEKAPSCNGKADGAGAAPGSREQLVQQVASLHAHLRAEAAQLEATLAALRD